MARLLVTGGAGFIGGNFVHYWRSHHPEDEIVVFDKLTYAGHRKTIAGLAGVDLIVGDICNTALVSATMRDHRIDTIVHFAAESHVDRSISAPDAFIETNVVGTHSLLKAALEFWTARSGMPHHFHHVSTDEVFGSLLPDEPPFRESTPYGPRSPYSASKAAADHLVRAYNHTFGLQVTISNCSNNYGPYQYPEKLIPLFLINALNGWHLPIYGDGMNVRDWLHVEDHCRGIDAIIQSGTRGETYNIGGQQELSNLAVIDTICDGIDRAFERSPELARTFPQAPAARGLATARLKTFVDDRAGHDRRYAIDNAKINAELKFVPLRDFSQGFSQTLDWYLRNEHWWRPIMLTCHR